MRRATTPFCHVVPTGARCVLAALAALAANAACLAAAEVKPAPASPGALMDYGSLMTYFVSLPDPLKVVVSKAVVVRATPAITFCYDAETMALAAVWQGGFLDMSATCVSRIVQGTGPAPAQGDLLLDSGIGPGWAQVGAFADPREQSLGQLPEAWVCYRGLYRHGTQVVVAYSVGDCAVRELPGAVGAGSATVITRTLRLGPSAAEQRLLVCTVAGAAGGVGPRAQTAPGAAQGSASTSVAVLAQSLVQGTAGRTVVGASGAPADATLRCEDGRVVLVIPAHAQPLTVEVGAWAGTADGAAAAGQAIAALPAPVDVDALCRGGAPQWGPALEVVGTLGTETGAYAVDTIPLPSANPWKSWIRPTGVDFFRDGRAAIATFSGDVWIASGVDQTLAKVSWRRYAAGLYEPLGLRIVDDVVYVLGRDQITRLVDVDHDGEADAYESFNHDGVVWPTYNNFAFDLQTDRAGNFYYAKGALNTPVGLPLQSVLCRVGKDGHGTTVVATGLRQPNGMGMGPHDEITVSDNEGQWVPASKIVWVRPGGWYGYVGDPPHYKKDVPAHPAAQDPPLCWMPMAVDSSSGGEAWAPPGWGPLGGQLLHTSYGKSSLMLVLHEEVGGVMQGAVMTLPLKFASGIMRARFSAADGQLYVCGIRGWQTTGAADGCLQRVRATAKPACLPIAMHVTRSGVAVTFSSPLDGSAADAGNIAVSCWNYLWSSAYGSAEYSVSDPKRKGQDHLDVTAATLSADKRTLTMAVTGVVPCMQMTVEMRVQAADGGAADATLYATVNAVGH